MLYPLRFDQKSVAALRGRGSAFTIKENLRIDKSLCECTAPTSNPLLDDKGDRGCTLVLI
ncbi:hypothetical protein B9G53_25565 [Pseudanabaena sp. SR411]|nr:hypothetical protein B9G53_25565 [Pseudanabaena sp. SR411]